MMKHVIVTLLVAGALGGCTDPSSFSEPDQCLRTTLFAQCMKALPQGPASTKYNDWDEVVSECGAQARNQSLRQRSQIAAACRIGRGP